MQPAQKERWDQENYEPFYQLSHMAKIPIEIIAEALNSNNLDQDTISKVMNDIAHMAQVLAEEEKAQREPLVKKQFIIAVSDPRGRFR